MVMKGLPIYVGSSNIQRSHACQHGAGRVTIGVERIEEKYLLFRTAKASCLGKMIGTSHFKKMVEAMRRKCFNPPVELGILENLRSPIVSARKFTLRHKLSREGGNQMARLATVKINGLRQFFQSHRACVRVRHSDERSARRCGARRLVVVHPRKSRRRKLPLPHILRRRRPIPHPARCPKIAKVLKARIARGKQG